MSGHLRFGIAAYLLVAAFSTPAASNPLTDLRTPNPPPEAAPPAPAPAAQDSCASRPGPAAPGGHWVYRYDGHRKCWFQAEGGGAVSKRAAHVTRRHAAASDDNESEPAKKPVEDARAEMVKAAPAETPQAPPAEPTLRIVHTVPVRMADAEAQVPPPPARDSQVVNQQAADQQAVDQQAVNQQAAAQPTPNQGAPRHVDVEKLLADAPAASGDAASAAAAMPIADPGASTGGAGEWISPWYGALLIMLGGVALLGASLRRVLWPVRSPNSRADFPDFAYDSRHHPSFHGRIPRAGARRDDLLHYDPQSTAPLAHAARPRRSEAPEPPSREALWEQGMDALAALGGAASPEVFRGRRGVGYRGVEE